MCDTSQTTLRMNNQQCTKCIMHFTTNYLYQHFNIFNFLAFAASDNLSKQKLNMSF